LGDGDKERECKDREMKDRTSCSHTVHLHRTLESIILQTTL